MPMSAPWADSTFVVQLPEVVNLGPAQVYFNAPGEGHSHNFQIQEFRRPEFEVIAQNETSGPYFVGGHAVLSVEAKYFAGGALPNAETNWTVTTSPGSYSPPNWPGFTFGTWRPWWRYYDLWEVPGGGGGETEFFSGQTDAGGFHYLRLDFTPEGDPASDPKPLSVSAEASVMDVNRQAWASSTSLLVHPADVYVGLRTARYFVQKGVPMKVDFIVADLDGKPSAGRPIEIEAARMEWKYVSGEWREQAAETQTCALQSSTEIQTCEFETPIGGTYRMTARVSDEQGRVNQSRITRWVSGGNIRPSRNVEHEEVTLIPDKETHQPGDIAEILVQSPFGAAQGLLTVARDGILYTERFSIDESGATILRIPIEDAHIPNLNLQIDLAGSAPRTDDNGNPLAGVPPRPAYAVGVLTLNIPPLARTLDLTVTPLEGRLEPGGGTSLNVLLKDAEGQPVADAEVAVVVVDEAILALTAYQMTDPLSVFYTHRGANLSSLYARASIILVDPLALAQQANQEAAMERSMDGFALAEEPAAAPMPTMMAEGEAGFGGGDSAPAPIRIRTDFNPLAVFAPLVRTGADGSARVQVNLPDNLTRYRVMAVAVDETGKRFGEGESNITARLPLMVRPSAPRFLNFGDKFELPVVLQNQTDEDMVVEVVARAVNLELRLAGRRVTVPANDRVEVRFHASAVMAGTTTIQVAAVSGAYADAATISLPVYTPATTEAFATYGVIDSGAIAQPVQYPTGVFPQYGGLEISTSSTALHALTDAVLYLTTYPYECSEQLASRILGIAALRDVLTAFKAEGLPEPAKLEATVARDIEALRGMQNDDGGFPYWQRGFESSPFNTVHVAHALVRAREKGYDVPDELLQPALAYLKNIENYYPTWYSPDTRRTLSAYAIFVRDLAGDRDTQKAETLLREAGVENLSLDAIGWLWPLVENETRLEEIRRHVGNRVVETPGAANFTIGYDDQTYLLLASNRRTDAILLNALMNDNPDSDLIPKVVNGLLAHRTKGRWGNTQENVFVLLSLDRYFNTYESQTPDFVARIWLGDTYAGAGTFEGRSTDQVEIGIPMAYVLDETEGGMQDLIISKEGAGRLYYRLGLRYAPTDLNMPPVDMGFVVQRSYEGVDNPEDVYKDAEGRWHIKAGAKVRVKLTMVADNRRYHVALVDPLPAGLEIINPALAVSGSVPQDPDVNVRYGWWWWGPWYEHQNLRDHRAEAFASLLWDGVYTYSYIARATTPGTFVVPPAKAEEMYSPEVFGRSAGDVVIVE
jgi:alpha-2-macroglobulin